jgi:tRNA (guanine-N7-)-methyltransferase
MSRSKLRKFQAIEQLPNIIEPSKPIYKTIKSKWSEFFGNQNPIVLELGCGYGEYTNGLAQVCPQQNFVGVDVKGERVWKGATDSIDLGLENTCFLRTEIEQLDNFFGAEEVGEIWLTFSDPQPNKAKRRLTHPRFLDMYSKILVNGGIVQLKTDSEILFDYTVAVIESIVDGSYQPEVSKEVNLENPDFAKEGLFYNKNTYSLKDIQIKNFIHTDDLYSSSFAQDCHGIQTRFENIFTEKGEKIKYLRFEIWKR